ncbi:peptide chain release factor 1, mitochondrial [Erpetoichthys calabaricus]|uniref:Mitochondrial translation release factor 1 n=1 Tax=Erpetoichthys calabaricus TaxID=27687 RepID=A0A8C4TAW2_ERPCA|nr:peptide chain release factor 1, mitochondrial [Erpetoichthys calabaricus]XP_028655483.1 peptide chain release factor 1, mitochondrial [Erpetoichthys calabaricus]
MKHCLSFIGCHLFKIHVFQHATKMQSLWPLRHYYQLPYKWPAGFPFSLLKQPRRQCHHELLDVLQQDGVKRYLDSLIREHRQVTQNLNYSALNEAERRTLNRRQIELSPTVTVFQETESLLKDLKEVEVILQSAEKAEDRQMIDLAKDEQEKIKRQIESLQRTLLQSLIPQEKHDNCDVILEVVSGRTTGGDICQQFTKEIFEMYQKFADFKQWTFEILNISPAEYGGLHHAAARISGESVYKHLKFEGGIHRVQRIPETGLSSRMQRIHTGTMTVIVLPQPEEVDIKIDPKDLRIDTFRAKGAGGQSVNTTDSAVRVIHIPTGISVECQQERSQLQNRNTAIRVLRAKLFQLCLEKDTQQRQTSRNLQVGTRSQSERIRTYNFTQDRVTDHRISYVARDIKEFLSGGEVLEKFINELLKSAEIEALLELVNYNSTKTP